MPIRPAYPRINILSPLAKGLVFAGLGGGAGSVGLVDASGYGNDGVLTGMDPATDWVWADELGRWALDFDGANDCVTAPNFVGLPTAMSFSLWSYVPSLTKCFVLGMDDLSAWDLLCYNAYGVLRLYSGNIGSRWIGNNGDFVAGQWQHFAAKYNDALAVGSKWSVYRNGAPLSKTSDNASSIQAGSYFQIGEPQYVGYTNLLGRVADACVWVGRTLCESEIAALADPSNVMLRCGGSALIREPRPLRSFLGQAGGAPPAGTPWLYCRRSARIIQ